MSRSGRLFDLVQGLRRRRAPVAAAVLADELGVSLRTLYRDISALTARGVPIRGEAGVGYILEEGHFLPPLSFSDDELDAIVLGLSWVRRSADAELAHAADDALAKIAAILPSGRREAADTPAVFVGPDAPHPAVSVGVRLFRDAIRHRRRARIDYADAHGCGSRRVIWPIGLAFMEARQMVIAWCELRGGFRHFRLDRISSAELCETYPERRAALLSGWRSQLRAEALDADTRCQHPRLYGDEGGIMAHDPKALQTTLEKAAPPDLELAFRPMFGGIMGYAGGKVFASLSDVGLALKLSGEDRAALLAMAGARPLQYAPDQPTSKSYVVVPEGMLSEPDELRTWIVRSTTWSAPPSTRSRKQIRRS